MRRLVALVVELVGGVLDAPLTTTTSTSGRREVRAASITFYLGEEE